MKNIYIESLSKEDIFNLAQVATPIGDVLDTPLKVVGIHHKPFTTAEGEEKLLTMVFVDEDGEVKSYFSTARSFFNGLEEVASIFGSAIEAGGVTLNVRKIETRNKNTVYAISL